MISSSKVVKSTKQEKQLKQFKVRLLLMEKQMKKMQIELEGKQDRRITVCINPDRILNYSRGFKPTKLEMAN